MLEISLWLSHQLEEGQVRPSGASPLRPSRLAARGFPNINHSPFFPPMQNINRFVSDIL
nr:MAG TPA: hypothetical protein [Caudoviricetes sp.]